MLVLVQRLMQESLCLSCIDYAGRRVVFVERQRAFKAQKRPELLERGIIERIRQTLESPVFVYGDIEHGDRLVYYRDEYAIDGIIRYMKVVVRAGPDLLRVITAYRPDYVKERGKTRLLYGTDPY